MQQVQLDVAESRHLVKALRARAGDTVTLFDGTGRHWQGVFCDGSGKQAIVRIVTEGEPQQPRPLELAIALLKGKAWDEVLRHAVEIGVRAIHPLITQNCEVRLDKRDRLAKQQRWLAQLVEAGKQSGNLCLPKISELQPLDTFLDNMATDGSRLIASLQGTPEPIGGIALGQSACVLIGPEGDFTPQETEMAQRYGFTAVRLGQHVLRAPTAALYALSLLDSRLA